MLASYFNQILKDTDSDAESEDSHGIKRRKRQSTPSSAGRKGTLIPLKKRLHAISKSLIDYTVGKINFNSNIL